MKGVNKNFNVVGSFADETINGFRNGMLGLVMWTEVAYAKGNRRRTLILVTT